jgi:hypothetical protein
MGEELIIVRKPDANDIFNFIEGLNEVNDVVAEEDVPEEDDGAIVDDSANICARCKKPHHLCECY